MKKILLIRTFKLLGAGNPIPPLGLLYIASAVKKAFAGRYGIEIIDTGVGEFCLDGLKQRLEAYRPDFIGLSALSCEADFLHEIAAFSKTTLKDVRIIAGGPYATVAPQSLLREKNVDFAVIGEGENTVVDLLRALEESSPLSLVKGIAFRENNNTIVNPAQEYIERLDGLPFPAWDLIDLKEYWGLSNWNGIPRDYPYFPILTSRGCPYQCTYCHNIFGKKVRMRSPINIMEEILYLAKTYAIKEFHIIDDIFNYDIARAKRLCSMIIASGLKISLAFPNGMRADNIDDKLISLFKKAGVYKINFGFETATPRLQSMIKKNLDISCACETVRRVSNAGIITGGYFMLGFPTETCDEIRHTIDFAAKSFLDVAYFFKVTPYPGSELFASLFGKEQSLPESNSQDLHFYSKERSYAQVSSEELNGLILQAQQRFYLSPLRILKVLFKSSHKLLFLRNAVYAAGILIQSYLLRKLGGKTPPSRAE